MTDGWQQATGGPDDQLGAAIDRAVRDLMAPDAPADLRARVLARLEGPPSATARWSPGRLAAAAATLAIVAIAAYLAWPSRSTPVIESEAVVAESGPRPTAPATAASVEAVLPEAAPKGGAGTPTTAPPSPIVRTVAATVTTGSVPYEFATPRLVEPLEESPLAVIEPLAEPRVTIEPITIDQLTFAPIVIDPLPMGY